MHAPHARLFAIALCASFPACTTTDGGIRWKHVDRTIEQPLAIGVGGELDVETDFGSVRVDAADGPPRVVAEVRAHAESEAEARALAESVVLRVVTEGESVDVRADHAERTGVQDVTVSLRITVPEGVSVRCRSISGGLDVTGPIGGCDAETRFGSVRVDGATGAVRASSGSGDVWARSVAGPDVLVESRFGSVVLEDVAVRDTARATTGSGDVVANNVSAASVELATDFGGVRARGVRAALRATTRSGDVSLRDVDGPTTDAESRFGSIEVHGLLRALTVRGSSGDVRILALRGSSCIVPWSVSTRFGNVELVVPLGFGADARLTAHHGVVTTDVPVAVSEARLGGQGTVITRLGDGGASLDVETTSGSIVVRRRDG